MIVDVIGPVIVAVHVHGNGTVIVIRPVNGRDATAAPCGRYGGQLSFQKLDVNQRSIEFLVFARRLLQRIPTGHGDLVDQLRRSSQSIPQNIAEGAGKTTRADKAKHYTIARGSAMHYAVGAALLERVIAMLTKMIDP